MNLVLAFLQTPSLPDCIDIALVVLLVIFCISGSIHGMAGECARLLALGTAIAVVRLCYPILNTQVFPGHALPWRILAMASTIILAALAGALAHWLSKKSIKILIGQPADAIIGGAIALATTVLAILVSFFFLYAIPSDSLYLTLFRQSRAGRSSRPIIEHFHERMAAHQEIQILEH